MRGGDEGPKWVAPAGVPSEVATKALTAAGFEAEESAFIEKDFWVGQIYPYAIKKDYYGQRVLPESLGNIEYNICSIDPTSCYAYTWQDIYTNAQYMTTVRDGVASFFFHPFWLEPELGTPGFSDFKSLVNAITGLGYTWTVPSQMK